MKNSPCGRHSSPLIAIVKPPIWWGICPTFAQTARSTETSMYCWLCHGVANVCVGRWKTQRTKNCMMTINTNQIYHNLYYFFFRFVPLLAIMAIIAWHSMYIMLLLNTDVRGVSRSLHMPNVCCVACYMRIAFTV